MKASAIWLPIWAIVSFLVSYAGFSATGQDGNPWKAYDDPSSAFHVQYPSQWHILQQGDKRLDILSFPKEQSARGAVLVHHGAEILVSAAPDHGYSLHDWINEETRGEMNVTMEKVPAELARNHFCDFTSVSYDDELGPGTWTSNKAYFCEAGGKLLQVRLTFLKGESDEKFLEVLNRMAVSLRP